MFIWLASVTILNAQTNMCLGTANFGSMNSTNFWARGGNTGAGNIFGTLNNVDIDIFTNNVQRMIINGTKTPTINGASVNTSGFVGIGTAPANAPGTPVWDCTAGRTGPWSLLHLQGPNNTLFTGQGWRTWMKTGTFTAENSDAMYVGLKNENATNGTNRSDAVINWSDDAAGDGSVDKLRFIFTGVSTGLGNNSNPIDGRSFNGYEFMRMAASTTLNGANFPVGYIGIGPVFTNTLPPQSRLHINAEDALATYIQIISK